MLNSPGNESGCSRRYGNEFKDLLFFTSWNGHNGPAGEVTAFDIQPGMLQRVHTKALVENIDNIQVMQGEPGTGNRCPLTIVDMAYPI